MVGLATVALVAAVVVGYTQWTAPRRAPCTATSTEVVGIASSAAEASATFTPQNPNANVDRLTAMMTPSGRRRLPRRIRRHGKGFDEQGTYRVRRSTVSAGVEAIGPEAAVVAVVMRGTQNAPGKQPATRALCRCGFRC